MRKSTDPDQRLIPMPTDRVRSIILGMEKSRSILRAEPGDRLIIRAHHTGEAEHDGEILEVLGEDGSPPFVVRWEEDGHVSRLYPGTDAYVQHFDERDG